MIRHEISETLVDCRENMLAERNLTVCHRNMTIEGMPDRSCPQGGVLSQLLWCLLVNDLLQDLQNEGFHIYNYVDDIAIIVCRCFLTTLRVLMLNALKIMHRWCKTNDLGVNPEYTNLNLLSH
jgi:hypothetical protein